LDDKICSIVCWIFYQASLKSRFSSAQKPASTPELEFNKPDILSLKKSQWRQRIKYILVVNSLRAGQGIGIVTYSWFLYSSIIRALTGNPTGFF